MSKILTIVPYKFLKPKNGGHWGVQLVEEILAIHNEVYNLGVTSNEVMETSYHQINTLPHSPIRYLPYLLSAKILKEARKIGAESIVGHHPYLYPATKRAAMKLGIPFYIRSHNIESERFKTLNKSWWKIMRAFEKKAYNGANKVFFVTEEDAFWAIKNYGLPQQKAEILPFPIKINQIPTPNVTKETLAARYQLAAGKPWIIFMGDLSYEPNVRAVEIILSEVYPRLSKLTEDFEIILTGKGLNQDLKDRIGSMKQMHYLGYVEDLQSLLNNTHLLINPVIIGGGVKTKVIEALGWNLFVLSTKSGGLGVNREVCKEKFFLTEDHDWDSFSGEIKVILSRQKVDITSSFFDYYNIQSIADRIQGNFIFKV